LKVLVKGKKVRVNGKTVYISPLELQIAYKMFLGSLKDMEDAKFLFELFEDRLDKKALLNFLKALKVKNRNVKEWLGI